MTTLPGHPLSESDLLKIHLSETQYKADLTLFNDGKALCAELLKIALAGIAVVGALLSFPARPWPHDVLFKGLLAGTVIVLGMAVGMALVQRFFASSGMFHHIKAMKLAASAAPDAQIAINAELAIRLRQFRRAHVLLIATAALVVAGAALLGGAFIRLMLAS